MRQADALNVQTGNSRKIRLPCDFHRTCDCSPRAKRTILATKRGTRRCYFDVDGVELNSPCDAGNVLYLKTERESSEFFNLIKAASDGDVTFVLAGDGTLQMYKVCRQTLKECQSTLSFAKTCTAVCAGYAPTNARPYFLLLGTKFREIYQTFSPSSP